MMQTQQPMPYMVASRTESGLAFLMRIIFFLIFLICAGNSLGIAFGKMDLVSWFTGFTVQDRDSLNLFIAYFLTGAFSLAVAARLYRLLWWLVAITAVILFVANWGKLYSFNTSGPSFADQAAEKLNFDNIPKLNGSQIPSGDGSTSSIAQNQLEAVTTQPVQPVTQTVSGQTAAQQKAAAAHKKAVNTWTNKFKKQGFTIQRPLNAKEKKWCKNPAARAAFKAKNPKREWIAEGRCVTGMLWNNT